MPNPLIPSGAVSPLVRHQRNPLLTSRDVPYPSTLVYNAGVVKFAGRYAMMFRNDYGRWGDPRLEGTNIGLAWSTDGVTWEVAPEPVITVEKARRWVKDYSPYHDADRELLFVNDPRLTVLEGRVYCCLAFFMASGLCGGVLVTDDFDHFTLLSMTVPDNRNLVIFPQRHKGHYLRFERPFNNYGGAAMGAGRYSLWLSESPDLLFWGRSRRLLSYSEVPYANERVGAGPQPVLTPGGWLAMFHSVYHDAAWGKRGWEPKWDRHYDAGLMLLDLDDPSKVLAVSNVPVLSPSAPYEMAGGDTFETSGFRGGVVFPTGMILEDSGEVKVYYGAADSFVCLATANVEDLLRFCLENPVARPEASPGD
ncbi:MAG: glycoside hydrolase family 130 protein [Planctomycetaceae bacterium]|nr:glycoside hydrolase family 130 protein [Planctomycetaceae bacterium]